MTDEMRHSIGGNFPPLLTEAEQKEFEERKAKLIIGVDECLENYDSTDKSNARVLTELAKMCNVFCNAVEEKRKTAKAPILEAGKEVDGKFSSLTDEVGIRVKKLKDAVLMFMDFERQDQLRTEHGALASVSRRMQVEAIDRKTLNLNALKKYLSDECIAEAALAFAKGKSVPVVKGITFKERSSITIR